MKIKVLLLILLIGFTFFNLFAKSFDELIYDVTKLYNEGKFKEAAELAEEAFGTGNPGMEHYYNAACCWALAGEKDNALQNLEKAIETGWLDADWLQKDKDLEILQNDERFKDLVSQLQQKLEKLEEKLPDKHSETEIIDLPEPEYDSETSIEKTLKERRSIRSYTNEVLTISEISQILWAAYGVTLYEDGMPDFLRGGLKTAPSAGATYPLEIYVVVSDVTDLPIGIYKYKPDGHKLLKISDEDKRDGLFEAAYSQEWVKDAPASLVYSAVFSRTTKRYGERGRERYVCMDLGHSAENVYLQVVSLNMGTVAIGAFDDQKLKLIVNMTKEEEPLYIMPLGKLEKKR